MLRFSPNGGENNKIFLIDSFSTKIYFYFILGIIQGYP